VWSKRDVAQWVDADSVSKSRAVPASAAVRGCSA